MESAERRGRTRAAGASVSPVPGEYRVEADSPNAATRSRGRSARESGQRSVSGVNGLDGAEEKRTKHSIYKERKESESAPRRAGGRAIVGRSRHISRKLAGTHRMRRKGQGG
jgi:hypothetical protein